MTIPRSFTPRVVPTGPESTQFAAAPPVPLAVPQARADGQPPEGLCSFGTEQVESLRLILNHISEAILMLDEHGRIVMVNPAAEALFGADRQILMGRRWVDFLCAPFAAGYDAMLSAWQHGHPLVTQRSHGPREAKLRNAAGDEVEVDVSIANLPVAQKKYLVFLHNLSEHKYAHHELRRLARTDHLTHLANRRAFDEVLARSWEDAARRQRPLSLIMIDIDHFKGFNDAHGHLQGDYCLRQVAQVIAQCCSAPKVLAARYGGEEFAVILPDTDHAQAMALATELQTRIRDLQLLPDCHLPPRSVTVSQGVATKLPGDYLSPFSFVAATDKALYRAKNSGRDRIVSATE